MHAPCSPNGSEVIRVIVAFVVAELAAAVIYAAEFAAEGASGWICSCLYSP